MPSPKQFRGWITTSKLTVETVKHAGIKMHIRLTVLEHCMKLHCDTHHCHPDIHPPSCLIYSELLNRCLFGINASEIKLQNNEMAACSLVMHAEDYWVHLDPFRSVWAHRPCVKSLSFCTKSNDISNISYLNLYAVVWLLQYAHDKQCHCNFCVYFHWKFEGTPVHTAATYAGG